MEFITEQIYKLNDIFVCLDLYEDISDMDLALKNKTKEKFTQIIEDIVSYNVGMATNSKNDLPTFEEVCILEISMDLTDKVYSAIQALEQDDNLILKECYESILEAVEKLVE